MIRAVDKNTEFRISGVSRCLAKVWSPAATPNVVSACVAGLEARRVDGRQRHLAFPTHHFADGAIKQFGDKSCAQESFGGFFKSGKVRYFFQFYCATPLACVVQNGRQSTIIGFQKGFQDEAREQLMLREFLWAEFVRKGRDCLLGNRPRRDQYRPWGFARPAHKHKYGSKSHKVHGFLQSRTGYFVWSEKGDSHVTVHCFTLF